MKLLEQIFAAESAAGALALLVKPHTQGGPAHGKNEASDAIKEFSALLKGAVRKDAAQSVNVKNASQNLSGRADAGNVKDAPDPVTKLRRHEDSTPKAYPSIVETSKKTSPTPELSAKKAVLPRGFKPAVEATIQPPKVEIRRPAGKVAAPKQATSPNPVHHTETVEGNNSESKPVGNNRIFPMPVEGDGGDNPALLLSREFVRIMPGDARHERNDMPRPATDQPAPVRDAKPELLKPSTQNTQPTGDSESSLSNRGYVSTPKPQESKRVSRQISKPAVKAEAESSPVNPNQTPRIALNFVRQPLPAHPANPAPPQMLDVRDVAARVRMSLVDGKRELSVRLKPEYLGGALIRLQHDNDLLKLDFEVEGPEARNAIEADASRLKEALAAAGLLNVVIEVRIAEAGSSHQQADRADHNQQGNNSPRRDGSGRDDSGEPAPGTPERRPLNLGYNTFDIAA